MRRRFLILSLTVLLASATHGSMDCCAPAASDPPRTTKTSRLTEYRTDPAQASGWSREDLRFFMNGSMSTEVIPEPVIAAFTKLYPALFPGLDALGIITDAPSDLPIGFSRKSVKHLGNLSSLGVNCASCHVGEVIPPGGGKSIRILGMTSHFDIVSFFGSLTVAMLETSKPENMEKFLAEYYSALHPTATARQRARFCEQIEEQRSAIATAMSQVSLQPGTLHHISADSVTLPRTGNVDLAEKSRVMLQLFHNIRVAVHIPDKLPEVIPPPPGPGRNDAFGLLSMVFFNKAIVPAYVKFGLLWNLKDRTRVHWDGNNDDPIARNLAAALGLGGPTVNGEGLVSLADIQRHTDLSEEIKAPKYPWKIDQSAVARGAKHYEKACASCHDVSEEKRLFDPAEIGTDPARSLQIDAEQERLYLDLMRRTRVAGYTHSGRAPFMATGKYWAADLAGVWARSPYLHNGSVRTMRDLLTSPTERPAQFRRGSKRYDDLNMGYVDEGSFLFNTAEPANSKAGHDYGTRLSSAEKSDLIEYLKTR